MLADLIGNPWILLVMPKLLVEINPPEGLIRRTNNERVIFNLKF